MPPSPDTTLYATYKGALIRSSDSGSTWIPLYVTEPGSRQPPVVDFRIDQGDSKTLYLETTGDAGSFWRSSDGGNTWAPANSGLPSTGSPVDFKQTGGPPAALYVRVGNQVFRSSDHAATWSFQSTTPSPSGALVVADAPSNVFYFIDAISLAVYQSFDFGHSWAQNGTLPLPPAPGQITIAAALLGNSGTTLVVSVQSPGPGSGAYLSTTSGGTFTDASSVGLGAFTRIDATPNGPDYAFGFGGVGFYRSDDGQTWKGIGVVGGVPYTLGAIDPNLRTTIYAVRGGSSPALIRSIDAGVNWTAISATITPTIAKPVSSINVVVQEKAPYSQSFSVQAYEDPAWALPVTLSTTGEPWLRLANQFGTTPLPDGISIDTTGLAPGTYQSSLTINAPQAFNHSVTIPVQLTIQPAGSIGPQFSVSTTAGNGGSSSVLTSGSATTVGIGGAKALAFDNSGRLLISGGNRIWQLSNGLIAPIAGNGVFGSSGDGADATQSTIADPDSILVDSQGVVYFMEFSTGRLRKILNNSISTVLDLGRLNIQSSHAILLDSFSRFILANPTGLLRFDGNKVQTLTSYPMVDPYAIVADSGNLYVSDRGAHRILKFAGSGAVTVVAGTGSPGFGGDGGPATSASLNSPSGLAIDAHGTIFIADTGNQRIRSITSDGLIHTIAGSGVSGFAGDGSTADFAAFQNPAAVAVDATGNLYVADSGNNRVRKLALAVVPTPQPTAVVHAASGSLQIAPGGLFSIYGSQLAPKDGQASTATWPKSLNQVAVSINGVFVPLYSVSAGLINGQVPYETAPGTATVIVTVAGSQPAQITAQVVPANPGLLLFQGRALAVNPDASVNGPDAPAIPGNFLILYLAGIGVPDHPIATGAPAPSQEPFPRVAYPSSISVGGQDVNVLYLGLAPGYIGLAQANIFVPDVPSGNYPVVVTVNGVASNSANISIRKP